MWSRSHKSLKDLAKDKAGSNREERTRNMSFFTYHLIRLGLPSLIQEAGNRFSRRIEFNQHCGRLKTWPFLTKQRSPDTVLDLPQLEYYIER